MNPYEPTTEESRHSVTTFQRQRAIFIAFITLGLLSWATLFAIRDIPIYPPVEPGEQRYLRIGLIACVAFSFSCAITGCFGIYQSIRRRLRPMLMTSIYLFAGVGLCYAGGVAAVGYLMIYGN